MKEVIKRRMQKDVRQGCNLSLSFFNIYIEQAVKECKGVCTRIKNNGQRIQIFIFAADIVVLAKDERNLHTYMNVRLKNH